MTDDCQISSEVIERLFPRTGSPDECGTWKTFPGLYDFDTLLPLLSYGLRVEDRNTAVIGGVGTMNCSVDWHDVLARRDLELLAAVAEQACLPALRLLLTASVDRDTVGFAAWFEDFAKSAPEFGFLRVCKLYGREPHFKKNLDAVWRAGWRAMVFTADRGQMRAIAQGGGDVLFRHASSPEDIEAMTGPRALVATSPHYLVPVSARQRHLSVRPPLPEREACDLFVRTSLARIDVIATDHVAAGATTGPGLSGQQHFLPAMMQLAETSGIDLASLLAKASAMPAKLSGKPATETVAVVAPRPSRLAPLGAGPRDPFLDTPFSHVVVAVVTEDAVARTPAFHALVQGEPA